MIYTEHIAEAFLWQVMHLLSTGTHVTRDRTAVLLVCTQKGILVVECQEVWDERNSGVQLGILHRTVDRTVTQTYPKCRGGKRPWLSERMFQAEIAGRYSLHVSPPHFVSL